MTYRTSRRVLRRRLRSGIFEFSSYYVLEALPRNSIHVRSTDRRTGGNTYFKENDFFLIGQDINGIINVGVRTKDDNGVRKWYPKRMRLTDEVICRKSLKKRWQVGNVEDEGSAN